jgi:FixJ family two-component response regulator
MPLIYVVDDDLSVCRALRRLIQSAGYRVETFASAGEFLDASPEGRTACLVLDIHLGGMSGFELQEQLAATRAAIPIIFITAYDDASIRERITRSGVTAYLRKPFDEGVLLDAIRTAVGQADGGGAGDGDSDGSSCAGAKREPFPAT